MKLRKYDWVEQTGITEKDFVRLQDKIAETDLFLSTDNK
jgi:hypothetical protein